MLVPTITPFAGTNITFNAEAVSATQIEVSFFAAGSPADISFYIHVDVI